MHGAHGPPSTNFRSGGEHMLNVIEFLERMGRDARLRHASAETLERTLEDAGVEPEFSAAILCRDLAALYALLGEGPLCSVQIPGDEEEEEDEGDEDDDDPFRNDDALTTGGVHASVSR